MRIIIEDKKEKEVIEGMCDIALRAGGIKNRDEVNKVLDSIEWKKEIRDDGSFDKFLDIGGEFVIKKQYGEIILAIEAMIGDEEYHNGLKPDVSKLDWLRGDISINALKSYNRRKNGTETTSVEEPD